MGPLTLALAALTWFGVLLQLVLSLRLATANGKTLAMCLVVYLGYFTVLTNILVATTLTAPLTAARREIWAPHGFQWLADVLLHYVVPLAFVAWWLVAGAKARFGYLEPLRWAAWPIAYLVYALVRGALIGLYAYPFIDVARIGYLRALLNSTVLLAVFLALGLVFVAVARRRAR